MDWVQSQDLMDIFLAEVDERGRRLLDGARALFDRSASSLDLEELQRDAHTLKGSSHMLGHTDVGRAASALERAWKNMRDGLNPTRDTVVAMESLTQGLLHEARSRMSPDVPPRYDLDSLTNVLERLLGSPDAAPPPPPTSPGPFAPHLPDPELLSMSGEVGDDYEADEPGYVHTTHGDANLGGLLAIVKDELSSNVTRVDTGDLYRLINRAVEIGLDTAALADLTHVAFENADPVRLLEAWRHQLERLAGDVLDLQTSAVTLANVALREAVETYPQFVRFLTRRLGRETRFEMSGTEVMVDRQIVDLLREPLRHLIVNAIDHGIEPSAERIAAGKTPHGNVSLQATVESDRLEIVVTDDGRGIDWTLVDEVATARGLGIDPAQRQSNLFQPGFTTVASPTDFSGTGEGLALVADAVDRIGGSVNIVSQPGKGTRITVDLPVSLVLQSVVIIGTGDQFFGVTEAAVVDTVALATSNIHFGPSGRLLVHEGVEIPVVSFARAMGLDDAAPENEAIVLSTRVGRIAVTVEEIIDRRRVAVKSLGPILEGADQLLGAAFLGGGEILVIVDHNHLGVEARRPEAEQGLRPRVLVVDDSAGVRQLISASLRSRGFDVTVAPNARDAVHLIAKTRFDVLVIDYSMPRSNGVELVRALRHAKVKQPIVMVSGVAEEEDKAAAWAAGVDAYLDKYDIRRGALATSIRHLLEDGTGR